MLVRGRTKSGKGCKRFVYKRGIGKEGGDIG